MRECRLLMLCLRFYGYIVVRVWIKYRIYNGILYTVTF